MQTQEGGDKRATISSMACGSYGRTLFSICYWLAYGAQRSNGTHVWGSFNAESIFSIPDNICCTHDWCTDLYCFGLEKEILDRLRPAAFHAYRAGVPCLYMVLELLEPFRFPLLGFLLSIFRERQMPKYRFFMIEIVCVERNAYSSTAGASSSKDLSF